MTKKVLDNNILYVNKEVEERIYEEIQCGYRGCIISFSYIS